MLKIELNSHNIFYSTQFHFISLVTSLHLNKEKNMFTISVVPWNCEKVMSVFENLRI